jgi:hypothetical protein
MEAIHATPNIDPRPPSHTSSLTRTQLLDIIAQLNHGATSLHQRSPERRILEAARFITLAAHHHRRADPISRDAFIQIASQHLRQFTDRPRSAQDTRAIREIVKEHAP